MKKLFTFLIVLLALNASAVSQLTNWVQLWNFNGGSLTNLNGGAITGAITGIYSGNASSTSNSPITLGQSSVTLSNGAAAVGFLGIDANGKATTNNSGAVLTGLNASSVNSGALADARLSSNVPLKDAANNFTSSTNTISGVGFNNGYLQWGGANSIGQQKNGNWGIGGGGTNVFTYIGVNGSTIVSRGAGDFETSDANPVITWTTGSNPALLPLSSGYNFSAPIRATNGVVYPSVTGANITNAFPSYSGILTNWVLFNLNGTPTWGCTNVANGGVILRNAMP